MSDREKIEALMKDAYKFYLDANYKQALQNNLNALGFAKELGHAHLIARTEIAVSRSFRWMHKPQMALDHIHNALALSAQFDDPKLLAFARLIHGRVLIQLGLSDDAYDELAKVIAWATENNDHELVARSLDWQAMLFVKAGNFEKAQDLLEQATALQDEHDFASLRSVLPLHRGFLHTRAGDQAFQEGDTQGHLDHFQIGLMWTKISIKASQETGDNWHQFVSNCNAAECAAVQNEFDLADEFLARIDKLPSGVMDVGAVHYLYTKSEVANRRGDSEAAIQFGLEALQACEANPDADNVMNAQRRVAEAYETDRQFENALKAHKNYHAQYRNSLAQKAYLQDRMAAYKANVKDMRYQLEQANVHADRMSEAANKDALTGLCNRRAFDQTLLNFDADQSIEYAIAVLDLDHFKNVNDNYSHLVGDDVLRFVADIMLEQTRSGDIVARIGGEEFAILMPFTSQVSAIIVCERIRKHISAWDWQSIEPDLHVSTSGGIALSHEGRDSHDVYATADSRLYQAKANGRNQVEAYALSGSSGSAHW